MEKRTGQKAETLISLYRQIKQAVQAVGPAYAEMISQTGFQHFPVISPVFQKNLLVIFPDKPLRLAQRKKQHIFFAEKICIQTPPGNPGASGYLGNMDISCSSVHKRLTDGIAYPVFFQFRKFIKTFCGHIVFLLILSRPQ